MIVGESRVGNRVGFVRPLGDCPLRRVGDVGTYYSDCQFLVESVGQRAAGCQQFLGG